MKKLLITVQLAVAILTAHAYTDVRVEEIASFLPERPAAPGARIGDRAALRSYMAALKQTGPAMKIAYGGLKGIGTQTAHLAAMRKTVDDRADAQFLTGKTLDAAFEGRLAVTTLVETRLNGLPDEDADPALDDSNAVSSRALGRGAVNTVYEVRYKDGSTYIFKPEAPGRQALVSLTLSKGAYQDNLLVAQLNMATQRTADAFGLGDVMTKTSVGAHGGQFGLFMEKAPGVEAELFGKRLKPAPDRLTAGQIRDLDDVQYAKVVGGLMRKANRLEWFDLITGQGDRHGKNYLVEVGKDGSVSLKGIDNDACFGKFMIGPGLFRLQGKHANDFKTLLKNANWSTIRARKLAPPGSIPIPASSRTRTAQSSWTSRRSSRGSCSTVWRRRRAAIPCACQTISTRSFTTSSSRWRAARPGKTTSPTCGRGFRRIRCKSRSSAWTVRSSTRRRSTTRGASFPPPTGRGATSSARSRAGRRARFRPTPEPIRVLPNTPKRRRNPSGAPSASSVATFSAPSPSPAGSRNEGTITFFRAA